MQAEAAECGLACLAMVCSYHGRNEGLAELRRRFPVSLMGSSLKSLVAIADGMGFSSRPVRCELDELGKLDTPSILHWDLDHFVVLQKAGTKTVSILDPARGLRVLPLEEVSKHFTGVALELTPAPHFQKKKHTESLALNDLWERLSGLTPVVIQLFSLSLLLQIFSLLMPIVNQVVIDDVIGHGDTQLLGTIIFGFALVAGTYAAIDFLRNYIQLHAGQKLSLQLSGNLLRHLLRLPSDFFERRHIGDIVGRFGSLGPVQNFLTGGFIGVMLDGLLVVPCGIIMFVYSPLLSSFVLAELVIALGIQLSTFSRARRYEDEAISLASKTQSIFLETIRAARAVKLSGREVERHSVWQNATLEQQNLNFRQTLFGMLGGSGFSLLVAVQGLLLLYFGAKEIMSTHISLGMFIAFQAYALQFSGRAKSLISQIFSLRMLGLHLERLSDIVHADEEDYGDAALIFGRELKGEVEIRNLDFRYAPQEPWVLKGLNFHIFPGERIALTGPSGGGKSTLLKLMTGLYHPGEGDIFIDGIPLKSLGVRAYREQIGVVMQDDQLMSGTIADNIAFFDAQIDMERVQECCLVARVHDDVMRLPMGYHSLIGDMGSVLSGGQKQRVLLARALYRRPRILFMDEGTANLDPALEQEILSNLKQIGITQIMVAHRQAAIDFATRNLLVCDRSVSEVTSDFVVEAAQ